MSFAEGTCANGTAATGADCPAPLMEQCSSCKPGGGLSFLHGLRTCWVCLAIYSYLER